MATPSPESSKLIAYLLKVMPESLEAKSRDGYTPLALAISLRRLEAARILIAAGADQTVRDYEGSNILHLLLRGAYRTQAWESAEKVYVLQNFLDLIDKRLVSSLLTERSSHEPGSLTPLMFWMQKAIETPEVLKVLLDFAAPHGNQHLELLDGSGDSKSIVYYYKKVILTWKQPRSTTLSRH